MRKALKFLRLVLLAGPRLVFDFFRYILPYSRHPEKTPIEVRYAHVRAFILKVLSKMKLDFTLPTPNPCADDGVRLYAGNHLSLIDPLILIALSEKPVSFIAKKETMKTPFVGRFIRAIDGLFLDREDAFQAVKTFRTAVKNMKEEGLSYGIFPEGTRNKDPYSGTLLPLRPGAFKIAFMAKCPIEPYVTFGEFHALDKTKGRSYPLNIAFLGRMEFEDISKGNTMDVTEEFQQKAEEALPRLLEKDQDYFASGRHKKKAPKWWKEV